jgi:RNA polymerase sigma factor (sigma-70 family)
MKNIRVTVKVQNANILRRMNAMGIVTVAELSRNIGVRQSLLGEIINMKVSARGARGEWLMSAMKLATFFKCLPEDLFSQQQEWKGLVKNTASRDVSEDEVRLLMDGGRPTTPEQNLLLEEGSHIIEELVETLHPRQRDVLKKRFGLAGEKEFTLEELALEYGVTRERIRQLELQALRNLKHPARSHKLRGIKSDFGLEEDWWL